MQHQSDRFDMLATILIALVTVFGAVVTWRASLAAEAAGNAEQQGLLETLALEEGLAGHETRLYTDLQYFVRYAQYQELARRLRQDEAAARERHETALADDLAREAELYEHLANNLLDFFDASYIQPDGTYDEARYLADLRLSDMRVNALAPDAAFAEADHYHAQTLQLVGLIAVLTVALFCYTLSQITEHRVKYTLATLGSLIFLGAMVWLGIIEQVIG